jgi:hypothetical protein
LNQSAGIARQIVMFHCRLSRTTLGYYRYGGTPTIIDPRASGNRDTDLTNVHEQTHKGLFDNTVYGYVLRRLQELADLGAQTPKDLSLLLPSLGKRLFLCAEGSATATELMHCHTTRPLIETVRRTQLLPDEYAVALKPFVPFLDVSSEEPPQMRIARRCLVQAIAEACADSAFLSRSMPHDFWDVIQCLQAAKAPDRILPEIAAAAQRLTGRYQWKPMSTQQEVLKQARAFIGKCKTKLARELGVPRRHLPMTDVQRFKSMAELDEKLTGSFPKLGRVMWTTERISNQVVAIEYRKPAFLMAEVVVTAEELLESLRSIAADPGFHFVIEFVREPWASTYRIIAHPYLVMESSIRRAEPYLVCLDAPVDVMRAIDQSGLPLLWLPFVIDLGSDGIYDGDFIRALQAPCFLELREFSWDTVMRVAGAWPGEHRVAFYSLPPEVALSISALEMDRATLFGLTAQPIPPDVLTDGRPGERDLATNRGLQAVVEVVLNRDHEESIDALFPNSAR